MSTSGPSQCGNPRFRIKEEAAFTETVVMSDRLRLRLARIACVSLALLLVGCSSGGPPKIEGTAVRGKVVYKGKGNVGVLANGKVRLRSDANPELVVFGTIEEDGSFVLGASAPGKSPGGVPAGEYKVRIEPPDNDDGRPLPVVHAKYMDFNRSGLRITVPPPGEVVLEVERP
jgi:hypothetical protein